MFKRVCLIAAVVVMAGPAFAESTCGTIPPAPLVPTADELSGKTAEQAAEMKKATIGAIHSYQAALKTFRACLASQTNALTVQVANAKDDAAKKGPQAQIDENNAANDKSVVDEESMVKEWTAFAAAYCKVVTCSAPKK